MGSEMCIRDSRFTFRAYNWSSYRNCRRDGRTSSGWDKIGFRNLLIGSIVFSLILSWIITIIYDINFNLVIFVVVQIFVIIATTMIWPALNSR